MTIQDWGAIGELVGGAAVVLTLVYLAVQLRQNTKSVETSALSGWLSARIAGLRCVRSSAKAPRPLFVGGPAG